MDLKKFLEENPLINKSELARRMWPGIKNPAPRLSAKLSEAEQATGKQRITETDEINAKAALNELADNIKALQ